MNRQFGRNERDENQMMQTANSLKSTSSGNTRQLYFSQYLSLKSQGIRETNSVNYNYDYEQLRERYDQLQQQLEVKEQLIAEMRQYNQRNFIDNNQDSNDPTSISNKQQIQLLQAKIKQLEKELKMRNKEHQFAQSIATLVQSCQPVQSNRPPTYKECWNWLKELLDEYVKLKNQK